ncbi:UNVERIFIED_CONTAM: hypothetical protein FKN15_072499 [Acipenser sinensis]
MFKYHDNAQLLVFVRFYDRTKKEFCEDLLGLTTLEAHTRGEDIHEAIKGMLTKRGIDLKSVVSISTGRGLDARLKEDHPDLTSYHCIIHQSVLCASLGEECAEVMTTMMKLINFLRASSSLQHRLLRGFLTEVNASYDDLLLHNNVIWLSKGRVLERFWTIREIKSFLSKQKSEKATQFTEFLEDVEKMQTAAFLVDITSHLNELNVKLQGQNNTV